MKIRKDNTFKLGSDEKRVGNFILKKESSHMKLYDINEVFTHRMRRNIPIGMFLEDAWDHLPKDQTVMKGVGNYIAMLWTVFSAVPDVQFLTEVHRAAVDCMERHPEAYGVLDGDVSDERDAEIIREEKELEQFREDVAKTAEGM